MTKKTLYELAEYAEQIHSYIWEEQKKGNELPFLCEAYLLKYNLKQLADRLCQAKIDELAEDC